MKKLVVVTNLLPHYQIDFYNRLVKLSDYDLTVFADISIDSPLNNFESKLCDFNVVNSPIKNRGGLSFRSSLRKQINTINPDHLIFYGNPRELSLTLLMLLYRLVGRSFNVHGMFHRIGGETVFSKIYYWCIGKVANKCFTYGRKGAEVLLGIGVPSDKIRIIGTAIDEKKSIEFSDNVEEKKLFEFKDKYGIVNKKIVLQVVRLSEIKKPDMLLYVAEQISAIRDDVVFVLIGGGEMYEEIKQKINKLELSDTILLLGPIYDEKELAYWFKSATVFVIPTCIGLSAHHAFSYSLPIVTDNNLTNQASEFDVLFNGLNSLLYQSGDVQSFQNKILKIVNDDNLQSFLSSNARHTVENIYSLDIKCQAYLNGL